MLFEKEIGRELVLWTSGRAWYRTAGGYQSRKVLIEKL